MSIKSNLGGVHGLQAVVSIILSVVLVFSFNTFQKPAYAAEDLMLLARIINAEAGEGCEIEHNQLVGCVVMNRVHSKDFPNTIKEVVYQRGQYSSVGNSRFNAYPSKVALDAAKYVLDGKAYCPSNVVFQANFKQGHGVYKTFHTKTPWFSSTTYFCYK